MKRAILICILAALVFPTAWTARPPTPAVIFIGVTAADAMQQAVDYLNETGSDPAEVYVTGPSLASDAEWRVVVVE